ncbi:hypothetical protein HDU80_004755 [Chytriomyces hyalinus]|nr:hypothetical protein HDU80_004755 [Chytriomyces hyalinus]
MEGRAEATRQNLSVLVDRISVFQRQVSKLGLSDTLMDASQQSFGATKFTKEELKDLFTYSRNTDCLSIQIAKEEVRESVMSGFEAFPFNDENRDASVAKLALKDEILEGVMQSGDGNECGFIYSMAATEYRYEMFL